MNFENLIKQDPQVNEILERELLRQQRNIELIASENIVSKAVMEAMGSYFTNKYAEGFIVKIFMNRKAISICYTSPNFMVCNTEGINYMCVGIPVEVYSDGKDTPEYYFGVR